MIKFILENFFNWDKIILQYYFDLVELITKKLASEKNAYINYVNTEIYP